MSYFPNLGSEMPTGIKGTALIGSKSYSTSPTVFNFTHPNSGSYQHNHIKIIRAEYWQTNDITGNFDAIDNDGTTLSSVGSSGYTSYRINMGSKLLLIGYHPANGLSSTKTARGRFSIISNSSSTSASTQYDKAGSLTQYFAPNYIIGGINEYSDALSNELNSSEIGKYFKLAGIDKLNDNLIYAYMENASWYHAYLGWRKTYNWSTPSHSAADTSAADKHFIYMIQFE